MSEREERVKLTFGFDTSPSVTKGSDDSCDCRGHKFVHARCTINCHDNHSCSWKRQEDETVIEIEKPVFEKITPKRRKRKES